MKPRIRDNELRCYRRGESGLPSTARPLEQRLPSTIVSIKRPAIFASAFAPHIGGVEVLTAQLAREQMALGMSPTVITTHWPKTLLGIETIADIPVLRHTFGVPELKPRHFAGWAMSSAAVRRRINAQLRDRDTDLIHVQCVNSNARYARAAARALGLPLVVTMQGELTMDATGLYQRSAQQRRAWRRLLDAADVVTGCSQAVIDDARAAYDASWVDRARVIPNGVRIADFAHIEPLVHDRPYILGIGRMVPQKGFDILLQAFAAIVGDVDVDLLLAGDGPVRSELERLAGELGLSSRVRFLGPLDRPAAASAFHGAEVFALPSRLEPQGIVVLEAMAAGTPVVASAVGGVPETVTDGVNGLLADGPTDGSLADAIRRVVTDPKLRTGLVDCGRRTAAERDWSVITSRYNEAYELAEVSAARR